MMIKISSFSSEGSWIPEYEYLEMAIQHVTRILSMIDVIRVETNPERRKEQLIELIHAVEGDCAFRIGGD